MLSYRDYLELFLSLTTLSQESLPGMAEDLDVFSLPDALKHDGKAL